MPAVLRILAEVRASERSPFIAVRSVGGAVSRVPDDTTAYANFLSSATEEDVAAIYPPEVYNRLAAVKRQYDPGNLFARNYNVRPD